MTAMEINEMLDREVNPKLLEHQGWVELARMPDEHTISIRFRGACSGCGAVRETLNDFVIPTILRVAPEITSVEVEDGVSQELYEMAVAMLSGH